MNNLHLQISPYLLQHQNNPVHWQPWTQEVLNRALIENKPILVSIGYAACHWCHVMEHESFEDQEVADLMNLHFVNIKVDREERPDIDMIYMDAIQNMGLHGGWPLNVFLLPNQKPFYGGTYFKKDNWIQVLNSIQMAFKNNFLELKTSADQFSADLQFNINDFSSINIETSPSYIHSCVDKILKSVDPIFGGIDKAPKFPLPSMLLFLESLPPAIAMEFGSFQASNIQLLKMAQGGIFDQIGGGFSRYSVDSEWFCPHFEKMSYDNSQLLSVYAKAFKRTNSPNFKEVIDQTIQFLDENFLADLGLYYSSMDADSEGKEGLYYTWTFDELNEIIPYKTNSEFYKTYQIFKDGNWEEHRNILYKTQEILNSKFKIQFEKLSKIRQLRISPQLDTKIILSYNALLVTAFVDIFKATNSKLFLDKAIRLLKAIHHNFITENATLHQTEYYPSPIVAFLDDMALLCKAHIDIYKVSGDLHYLREAEKLIQQILANYQIENESFPLFKYSSSLSEILIAEKIDYTDSVMPSSNSVVCECLLELGYILDDVSLTISGRKMIELVLEKATVQPNYFANWLRIYSQWFEYPKVKLSFNVNFHSFDKLIEQDYPLEKTMIEFYPKSNVDYIFMVCIGEQCFAPTKNFEELIDQLKEVI